MGQDLERYQQEIDAVFKPIATRLEHYQRAMSQIRMLLKNFFFDETRIQKLTQPAKGNEVVFSFNLVENAMEYCLVDEKTWIESAQYAKDANVLSSLVAAFDANSLNSGLPLELNENGLYVFKPENPYTNNAQMFMEQFAYALSTYRMCVGVYETYFLICNYEGIKTEWLKQYIEFANTLKQQVDGEVNLIELYQQVTYRINEITGMLGTQRIHEGFDTFGIDFTALTKRLEQQLISGATHLQEGYEQFPNDAILWMIHSRSWHTLIRHLSSVLFFNKYSSSTLYTTLNIEQSIIKICEAEVSNFSRVALTNTPLIKIELLKQAGKLLADTQFDILAKLAEHKIELPDIPAEPRYSTQSSVSSNIYSLMFRAAQSLRPEVENQPYQLEYS